MTIKMRSTYRILGYQPTVNPAWRQKLLTMGMLPGAVIEVVRVAPMGDPIEIRTRRVSLAVRQRDLSAIILEEVTG
ncbi:ferrous iron transporter A [Pantoea sp. C2G6]|uniref:ferrous iron transporter A n=1 Tax=Pantoea sp. C2G6 TaxID=3243084 RepID=UPI003ED8F216